ncbi:MAG: hypothetical protein ABI193_16060 [Minicystis sp.]
MRFHFITVPIHGGADAEVELNQFLSTHRVLAVDRQLVADGPRSVWAICVTYVGAGSVGVSDVGSNKRGRIDYREILPEAQFQVFVMLRDLRKKLSDRESARRGGGLSPRRAHASAPARRVREEAV